MLKQLVFFSSSSLAPKFPAFILLMEFAFRHLKQFFFQLKLRKDSAKIIFNLLTA